MNFEQMAYAKEISRRAFASCRFSPVDFSIAKNHLVSMGVPEEEAESVLAMLSDNLDCVKWLGMKPDPAAFEEGIERLNRAGQSPRFIFSVHGIRTDGPWQRILSDLVTPRGWTCRLDRWSFGRFNTFLFVLPFTRERKIDWFRRQYDLEMNDTQISIPTGQLPSIVAHSFGTYILGYTLLRFDFIRFDKVILCGSILPRDFPWDVIIGRGQVQAVRNEHGVRDPWVKRVRGYVRNTGCSGSLGFTRTHARLYQESFDYNHGDYFGRDHMLSRWIPFLEMSLPPIPSSRPERPVRPPTHTPWGVYVGLGTLLLLLAAIVFVYRSQGISTGTGLVLVGGMAALMLALNLCVFVKYSRAEP